MQCVRSRRCRHRNARISAAARRIAAGEQRVTGHGLVRVESRSRIAALPALTEGVGRIASRKHDRIVDASGETPSGLEVLDSVVLGSKRSDRRLRLSLATVVGIARRPDRCCALEIDAQAKPVPGIPHCLVSDLGRRRRRMGAQHAGRQQQDRHTVFRDCVHEYTLRLVGFVSTLCQRSVATSALP